MRGDSKQHHELSAIKHPLKASTLSNNDGIRLNKFISSSGQCSRREADKLIETNRVKINGKRPELGARVEFGDEVTVDGVEIANNTESKSDRIYIVYNKPIGITCTTEQHVKGNIIDAVDHDERVFPIGRLDKPSEGLILLTSDGDIVNKILRAENAHSKEYIVTVNKTIAPDFASRMSKGIPILDTVTKPCKVAVLSRNVFKITLTQGLNRQIRRMCDYLGYDVVQLQRSRIMNVELGRLKPGQWRNVTRDELAQLNKAIEGSSSEASKSPSNARGKSARKKPARKRPEGKPEPKKAAANNAAPKKPRLSVAARNALTRSAEQNEGKSGAKSAGKDNRRATAKPAGRSTVKNRAAKKTSKRSSSPPRRRS
ncbi:MAG: 23S rRNA pseudouridine(2604) synthase RluF [Pseudomonadales bacterium]